MSHQEIEEYKAVCDTLISMMREALDELDEYCDFFRGLKEIILKSQENPLEEGK